jgi:hypothetical protein
VVAYRARNRERLHAYSADYHRRTRGRKFGLGVGEYDEMFAAQGGLCAVCGKPEHRKHRTLAVDHDHASGVVRALLCHDCNTALGLIHERRAVAYGLAAYLDTHLEAAN